MSDERPPLGLVALGGALGTGLRLLVMGLAPLGLPLVNVSGSLALGLIVARTREGSRARWLLGPGLLGAYTTFSAFALELAIADPATSALLGARDVALGLAGAALGLWLGRHR